MQNAIAGRTREDTLRKPDQKRTLLIIVEYLPFFPQSLIPQRRVLPKKRRFKLPFKKNLRYAENPIMEKASGELIRTNPADPKDSETSYYAKKEKRDPGSTIFASANSNAKPLTSGHIIGISSASMSRPSIPR